MPRPPRNQPKNASRRSLALNTESDQPHDPLTRASHGNARRNLNTRASRTRTNGRTSGGGPTAPHTVHDPAPSAGRLADLCSECECILNLEEKKASKHNAAARRDRCDDCYRKSPVPMAPISGPSYSFGTSFRYVKGRSRAPAHRGGEFRCSADENASEPQRRPPAQRGGKFNIVKPTKNPKVNVPLHRLCLSISIL